MNASIDDNGQSTLIAALNTDGTTITRVQVNPSNHGLRVSDGSSGSDYGTTHALRDDNNKTTLIAVSSADGVTPVDIYCDSNGMLLIQST